MTLLSSSIIFLEPCFVQRHTNAVPCSKIFAQDDRPCLVSTYNEFLHEGMPLYFNVHWVNPMGSMLVPVAVTTVGNLSLVRLRLRDSKVLRLMQLMDAPVSYNALILMFEVVIGKIVPVVGPTTMVQISTKWGSVLFTLL